jgi:effector-binding domain-containing protein
MRLLGWVAVLAAGEAMAVEKLAYEVLKGEGALELRRVAPHVVAETEVVGNFEDVGSEAFRRLVRYISGDNRARSEVAMTAPVTQEPASQEIAMTAPVTQQREGDRYRVSFVMPAEYTLDSLPEPTDPRVQLRAEPARTMATIRYSGFWSRGRYERHERELLAWIESRGLRIVGRPVWARYDPPFMPWFLRRNEILIEVEGP